MPDLFELQKAIYARLRADGTLMGKVTGVYENAEQGGSSYPYVTIGTFEGDKRNTNTRNGREVIAQVRIYTDAITGFISNKKTLSIESDIDRLLGDVRFDVSGWQMIVSYYQDTRTFVDRSGGAGSGSGENQGESRQILMRFRIILYDTSERGVV